MARPVTIANLITRAKQRADAENASHVSDAEWQVNVAEGYSALHKIVVQTGCRRFESEDSITATGAATYNLPAGFMHSIGIDYVMDAAGSRRPLQRVTSRERAGLIGITGEAFYYEVTSTTVTLYPKPSSGSYKHLYIPQPTDYTTIVTTTEVDTLCADGEKLITWTAAMMALQKGEQSVQLALREIDKAEQGVLEWTAMLSHQDGNRRNVAAEYARRDPGDWWP